MKYIKLYEQHNNIDSKIDSYLKEGIFDNLPKDFKKGLLTWMYEGEPVEWSYTDGIKDWINDPNVDILINDYSKEMGSKTFKYGFVPTELVIEKLTPIITEYGYSSFEEWREAYQSTNDANHGDSRFPIIIGDEYEWIWDGWHRLNYYLHNKVSEIPVIEV